MLPLRDDVPARGLPLVTVGLIAANLGVYGFEFFLWPGAFLLGDPALAARAARGYQAFLFEVGFVPCRVTEVCPPALSTHLAGLVPAWLTVFTGMFVHAGLFHVGGNMLYLWIFGDGVEDAMGKGRFLLFYLTCGVVAAAAQYAGDPRSPVPMVGASGAVSGVLGAYLVLYPRARVWTLVFLGPFFWRIVRIPALALLGLWIVVQLLNSLITFANPQQGGVAVLAHVGGFAAGLALVGLFRRRSRFVGGRA